MAAQEAYICPQASMAHGTDGVTRAVVAWCDQVPGDAKINRLDNFATGSWSGQEIAESLPPDPGVQVGSIDVAMAQNGDFMLVFTEAGVTTSAMPTIGSTDRQPAGMVQRSSWRIRITPSPQAARKL